MVTVKLTKGHEHAGSLWPLENDKAAFPHRASGGQAGLLMP